ncbi:hypothetical protein AGMMS49975_28740 [Clostridia bacterium]|nr:hypothetical protein AGMMS49975_28740 [Clostridia bacterium]
MRVQIKETGVFTEFHNGAKIADAVLGDLDLSNSAEFEISPETTL